MGFEDEVLLRTYCGSCVFFELDTNSVRHHAEGFSPVMGACVHPAVLALPYSANVKRRVQRCDGGNCATWRPKQNEGG